MTIYGQGTYGRIIDVRSSDPSDPNTLMAYIDANLTGQMVIYTKMDSGLGYLVVDIDRGSALERKVVGSLSHASSSKLVAKLFVDTHISAENSFIGELVTNLRIMAAFGDDLSRLTTVRGLPVDCMEIYGIRLDGMYFMISDLCKESLDMHVFSSFAPIRHMVDQVLEALHLLHSSRMLHGDIKGANIICCGSSYKLIDWGLTATFDEIRKIYSMSRSPRNCASPLAWYAWGLTEESPEGEAARVLHRIMHAKVAGFRSVFSNAEFQKFTEGAFDSHIRHLSSIYASRRVNGIDANARRTVIREFLPSFDLYNLGLVVAGVCLRAGPDVLADDDRQRLMDFAVRLTHYDHEEFVGNDAVAATKLWSALLF